MRVVHLETGRRLYGGALQVAYLLQGLAGGSGEHVLVCPPDSGVARAAGDAPAATHAIPVAGDLDPGLVWRLAGILRREGADLLHVHSRRGADYWGGLAARAAGVPAVLTRRVDNPERPWAARRKYRLYRRVVCISHGIREVLARAGVDPAHTRVIPSAVDTGRFRPRPGARDWLGEAFGVPAGAPVVAMAAQLIPRKGHHTLLRALPAVLRAHPHLHVLLFGQGRLEKTLAEGAAALGEGGQVRLCGFRDDLERILPGVDLVVHPARMEGLGVVLLQAAACAVPVVATRVGGIPDAVADGETGVLVPADDPGALAEAMNGLLAAPERRRALGERARARVESGFSIAAMAAAYAELYREVAGPRG